MRPRSGFSLVETIIATFILVGAALVAMQLFDVAIRSAGATQDETLALMLARERMGRIQRWAAQAESSRLNFNGAWTDEAPAAHPIHARFRVGARSWPHVLHSPARALQGAHPMSQSARLVKVTVQWRSAGLGAVLGGDREVSLVGVVGEPPRRMTDLQVSLVQPTVLASPLGANQYVVFQAVGRDAGGTIPDLRFRWYVDRGTGSGTVSRSTSDQGQLFNYVTLPSLQRRATGGQCRVKARGISDARESWAVSRDVPLAGPTELGPPPYPTPSPATVEGES